MLHYHFYLYVALTKDKKRYLENFEKENDLSEIREHWMKKIASSLNYFFFEELNE